MGDDEFATHDPLTGQLLCSCIKSNVDDSVDMTGCPVHAPSPVRDDGKKAIAGLLAEHRWPLGRARCSCDEPTFTYEGHESHVASVIAAHMAAPDELTALRERIRALAYDRIQGHHELQLELRTILGDS